MVRFSLLVTCVLVSLFALGLVLADKPYAATPSQSVALDVSTYTGDVSFSIPLPTIPGKAGNSFQPVIVYNSDVYSKVHNDNFKAQASWVGLGFDMEVPYVYRDYGNDFTDASKHEFFLNIPGLGGGRLIEEAHYRIDVNGNEFPINHCSGYNEDEQGCSNQEICSVSYDYSCVGNPSAPPGYCQNFINEQNCNNEPVCVWSYDFSCTTSSSHHRKYFRTQQDINARIIHDYSTASHEPLWGTWTVISRDGTTYEFDHYRDTVMFFGQPEASDNLFNAGHFDTFQEAQEACGAEGASLVCVSSSNTENRVRSVTSGTAWLLNYDEDRNGVWEVSDYPCHDGFYLNNDNLIPQFEEDLHGNMINTKPHIVLSQEGVSASGLYRVGGAYAVCDRGSEFISGGKAEPEYNPYQRLIYRWDASRITDRFGNNIFFEYHDDDNDAQLIKYRKSYLNRIYDDAGYELRFARSGRSDRYYGHETIGENGEFPPNTISDHRLSSVGFYHKNVLISHMVLYHDYINEDFSVGDTFNDDECVSEDFNPQPWQQNRTYFLPNGTIVFDPNDDETNYLSRVRKLVLTKVEHRSPHSGDDQLRQTLYEFTYYNRSSDFSSVGDSSSAESVIENYDSGFFSSERLPSYDEIGHLHTITSASGATTTFHFEPKYWRDHVTRSNAGDTRRAYNDFSIGPSNINTRSELCAHINDSVQDTELTYYANLCQKHACTWNWGAADEEDVMWCSYDKNDYVSYKISRTVLDNKVDEPVTSYVDYFDVQNNNQQVGVLHLEDSKNVYIGHDKVVQTSSSETGSVTTDYCNDRDDCSVSFWCPIPSSISRALLDKMPTTVVMKSQQGDILSRSDTILACPVRTVEHNSVNPFDNPYRVEVRKTQTLQEGSILTSQMTYDSYGNMKTLNQSGFTIASQQPVYGEIVSAYYYCHEYDDCKNNNGVSEDLLSDYNMFSLPYIVQTTGSYGSVSRVVTTYKKFSDNSIVPFENKVGLGDEEKLVSKILSVDKGTILSTADGKGRVSHSRYDPNSNVLVNQTNALGHTIQYEYSPRGKLVTSIQANGVTNYAYDPLGRLIEIGLPGSVGPTEFFEYHIVPSDQVSIDNPHKVTSKSVYERESPSFSYERTNYYVDEVRTCHPYSSPEDYQGRVARLTCSEDRAHHECVIVRGHQGYLPNSKTCSCPEGSDCSFALSTTSTICEQNPSTQWLDGFQCFDLVVDADDGEQSMVVKEYDGSGGLIKTRIRAGQFDVLRKSVADDRGLITDIHEAQKVNAGENIHELSTSVIHKTYYSDGLARQHKVWPLGQYYPGAENHACNEDNPCTESLFYACDVPFDGHTIEFTCSKVIDPKGTYVISTQDSFGNTIRTETSLGVTHHEYDLLGRLVKSYDERGRLVLDQEFNTRGELIRSWNLNIGETTFTYDLNGNVETQTTDDYVTRYTYDELNRVLSITRNDKELLRNTYDVGVESLMAGQAASFNDDSSIIQGLVLHDNSWSGCEVFTQSNTQTCAEVCHLRGMRCSSDPDSEFFLVGKSYSTLNQCQSENPDYDEIYNCAYRNSDTSAEYVSCYCVDDSTFSDEDICSDGTPVGHCAYELYGGAGSPLRCGKLGDGEAFLYPDCTNCYAEPSFEGLEWGSGDAWCDMQHIDDDGDFFCAQADSSGFGMSRCLPEDGTYGGGYFNPDLSKYCRLEYQPMMDYDQHSDVLYVNECSVLYGQGIIQPYPFGPSWLHSFGKGQPYFCQEGQPGDSGSFVNNCAECGCPPTDLQGNPLTCYTGSDYPSLTNSCVRSTCDDGTALYQCSENQPLKCTPMGLIPACSECGCSFDNLQACHPYSGQCTWNTCIDGTAANTCSESESYGQGWFCSASEGLQFPNDSGLSCYLSSPACGCPTGQVCNAPADLIEYLCDDIDCQTLTGQGFVDGHCYPTHCQDGTPVNECNNGLFCNAQGDLVQDCNECGCSQGLFCAANKLCEAQPSCDNGATLAGSCSNVLGAPFFCDISGNSVQDCSLCGCPENQVCTAQGTCQAAPSEECGFSQGRLCVEENKVYNNDLRYTYDVRGNIIEVKERIGSTTYSTKYEYNLANQLTKTVYPNNKVLDYSYDDLGHLRTMSIDGSVIEVDYNDAGHIRSMSFPNGVNYVQFYDLRNRVQQVRLQKSIMTLFSESYEYDSTNKLVMMKNFNQKSARFDYDEGYRLATVDNFAAYYSSEELAGDLKNISYDYDLAGNRVALLVNDVVHQDLLNPSFEQNNHWTTGAHNWDSYSTQNSYSGQRSRAVTPNNNNPGTAQSSYQVIHLEAGRTYEYSAMIFRSQGVNYNTYIDLFAVSNGQVVWDGPNKGISSNGQWMMAKDTVTIPTHLPSDTQFRFRLVTDGVNSQSYGHTAYFDDVSLELLNANPVSMIRNTTYQYDIRGDNDRLDRLQTSTGVCDFYYTNIGQLERKECGNQITKYFYNMNHQLSKIEYPGAVVDTYEYDVKGRRVRKQTVSRSTSQTYTYVYGLSSKPLLVLETSKSTPHDQPQFDMPTGKVVYEPTGDEHSLYYLGVRLVAHEKGTDKYFIHQDALLNNRVATRASGGQIAGAFKSLPFGTPLVNTNMMFSYMGQERDRELYYFGARYYDEELGRFISHDKVDDGNPYALVNSNPFSQIDLDGNEGNPSGYVVLKIGNNPYNLHNDNDRVRSPGQRGVDGLGSGIQASQKLTDRWSVDVSGFRANSRNTGTHLVDATTGTFADVHSETSSVDLRLVGKFGLGSEEREVLRDKYGNAAVQYTTPFEGAVFMGANYNQRDEQRLAVDDEQFREGHWATQDGDRNLVGVQREAYGGVRLGTTDPVIEGIFLQAYAVASYVEGSGPEYLAALTASRDQDLIGPVTTSLIITSEVRTDGSPQTTAKAEVELNQNLYHGVMISGNLVAEYDGSDFDLSWWAALGLVW